jgi:apolipoprotein N-acyltransferase
MRAGAAGARRRSISVKARGGCGFTGRLGLGLATAALLTLAFPPFGLPALAWVGLAPLLLAFRGAGPVEAFGIGFLSWLAYQAGVVWWLVPAGVHPAAFLAGTALVALSVGAFGLVASWLLPRQRAWTPLVLACTWAALDAARLHAGWLSSPGAMLGLSQYRVLPVAGLASLGGLPAVSFALVAVNALLAALVAGAFEEARSGVWRQRAVSVVLAGGSLALLGTVGPGEPPRRPEAQLRVAVIQAGTYEPGATGRSGRAVFADYARLTRRAAAEGPLDLVVWPETAVATRLPRDRETVAALGRVAREAGAYLLTGASGRDKLASSGASDGTANAAFLFSPQGELLARYDKVRLLPFNEYLPLRGIVRWPEWIAPEMEDAVPGTALRPIELGSYRVGVQICWENALPGGTRELVGQGADLLVSLTNESFNRTRAGHEQLLAMNVYRAIESGVPVVRAATTGVSAVIGPDGRIEERVRNADGRDTEVLGYLVKDVSPGAVGTTHTRLGGGVLPLLGLAAIAAFAVGSRRFAGGDRGPG